MSQLEFKFVPVFRKRWASESGLHWLLFVIFFLASFGGAQASVCRSGSGYFDVTAVDSRFSQGTLEVPLGPGSSETLSIAYFFRPANSANSTKSPILFFNGGPGVDSHDMLKEFSQKVELEDHPLVFMDQRGTGCSSPYPHLEASDINRSLNWGSRAIVRDAEALRKKLFGDQPWKIFGHSFGGLITYRYIVNHPMSVVSGTVFGYALTDSPVAWLAMQTEFIGTQTKNYSSKYPRDFSALEKARQQISKESCLGVRSYEICGPAILDILGQYLAYANLWPTLHNWIVRIDEAVGTAKEAAVMSDLGKVIFRPYMQRGESRLENAISNFEIVSGLQPHEAFEKVDKALEPNRRQQEGWLVNPIRFMRALDLGDRQLIFRDLKSDPLHLKDLDQVLRRHLNMSLTVFSGEWDGIVPPSMAQAMARRVGDLVEFHTLPRVGHNEFTHDAVVAALGAENFVSSKCERARIPGLRRLIEKQLVPWLKNQTSYKTSVSEVGRPILCPVHQDDLAELVLGDPDHPMASQVLGFFSFIGGAKGVLYVNEALDFFNPVDQEKVLHEFIHFLQLANGTYTKVPCIARGEKEAYLLGGTYLDHQQTSDPVFNRTPLAFHRSRCQVGYPQKNLKGSSYEQN